MFDIGNVFASVANAVLPSVSDAHSGQSSGNGVYEPDAAQSTQVADPLASYVAMNGLHSIATAHSDIQVSKDHDCNSQKIFRESLQDGRNRGPRLNP